MINLIVLEILCPAIRRNEGKIEFGSYNMENNWAREASPTPGCSIEISGDIYYVGRYVCHVPKCVGGNTCAHAQSHFWAVKTDL